MARMIGILAGKGGVGKTTVAINLACALGLLDENVCLVDFNFTTSHLAMELGIVPYMTLNHVLRDEVDIGRALYQCYGISILPASLSLSDLEDMNIDNLKPRMNELLSDFEIVILDSAPGFGREAISAIQSSDDEIFVANPTTSAITDIIKCKNLSLQLGVNPLGIVVNKYRNKKYELEPKEISLLTELPLLAVIREDEDFLKSEARKIPLIHQKEHKAEEFLKLACMLTGRRYEEPSSFNKVWRKMRSVREIF